MAATTSENYVTETIFVPLYNRSAGFRKLISKAFPNKINFGNSIHFTGNERNTNFTEKYGCPDAKSDIDNIIEIKINYSAGLTDNEKEGGCNGIGYEKYLKDNKDKYLLYVIPEDYDLNECVKDKQRVGVITWQKILSYLIEQNEYDPFIPLICNKIEGIGKKEIRTLSAYKAKIYETLIMCMDTDNKLHIHLNEEDDSIIRNFPESITKDEFDFISFDYDGIKNEDFFIYFEKKNISFYLPQRFFAFKTIAFENGFIEREDDWLQLEIITQDDFWKWETNKIEKEIIKKLKLYIKTYSKIENEISKTHEIFSNIFCNSISDFAKENNLIFEYDKKEQTLYLKRNCKVNWWYALQFQEPEWRKLCYGIFYEGNNKSRKLYSKILSNSKDDSGYWVSYKDVDDSYKNWGSEIFSKIQKNPLNFINKYIKPLFTEIDSAIKKLEK